MVMSVMPSISVASENFLSDTRLFQYAYGDSLPLAGTEMALSWMGEDQKSYGVETNSNLIISDWQSYMTGIAGEGTTITITVPINNDKVFYRVISE